MSPWLIALHCGLAFVAFLLAFNGYLRGSLKYQIHAVLVLISLGLMLLGWFFGWKGFVAAVILYFVYYMVTTPVARALAWRSLGHRTSFDIGQERSPIEGVISGKKDVFEMFDEMDNQRKQRRKELERIASQGGIRQVLEENELSIDDLEELYRSLELCNLGEELRYGIVRNPRKLRELIDMRQEGCSIVEIYAHFTRL